MKITNVIIAPAMADESSRTNFSGRLPSDCESRKLKNRVRGRAGAPFPAYIISPLPEPQLHSIVFSILSLLKLFYTPVLDCQRNLSN